MVLTCRSFLVTEALTFSSTEVVGKLSIEAACDSMAAVRSNDLSGNSWQKTCFNQ